MDIDHDITGLLRDEAKEAIASCSLLVGFNLKYDLHWLKRLGISFAGKKVWDGQLAHFLLTSQKVMYPSLAEVCQYYGIEGKIDAIAENYWSKGIDTPDIPKEEILAYLAQDLKITQQIYQRQLADFEKGDPRRYNLFKMDMDDLLVLQDMEWNGLKFNVGRAREEKQKLDERLATIEEQLRGRCPNTPVNFDSVDHVSAYLYGGTILMDRKEPAGLYKTGGKVGQIRYRWVTDTYKLERLVEPLEGSELKKDGLWGTGDDVLKQLKQVPEVKLLQERGKLTKLRDYLHGFPELIETKDWTPGELHGQFNQVVARTGRLSSSNPNLQNLPDPVLALVETRYEVGNS